MEDMLRNVNGGGANSGPINNKRFPAFTLAEMMVVLLIMTIVLAAAAPIMTTKMKKDGGGANGLGDQGPWKWADGNINAYFNPDANDVTAMIGQQTHDDTNDNHPVLLLNKSDTDVNHILFKEGGTAVGHLYMSNNNDHSNMILGGGSNSGNANTILGLGSMTQNTTGSNNVSVGFNNLSGNKTGSRNVAIGSSALLGGNASGEEYFVNDNIAIGSSSLQLNSQGNENIAIGTQSLEKNTSGDGNVSLGYQSLQKNTTGSENIALGSGSLASNRTGNNNIAIGRFAMRNNGTGRFNIAIGEEAMGKSGTDSSNNNIALGYKALYSNSLGGGNIAIGYHTDINNPTFARSPLESNTVGNANIAIGGNALSSNTTGSSNIAIGTGALSSNATGGSNIAIGGGACQNVTGSSKICIGSSGPNSGTTEATDAEERIYIGGAPKDRDIYTDHGVAVGTDTLYGSNAVVEIHNISSADSGRYGRDPKKPSSLLSSLRPTVYINANLVVRGYTWTVIPDDKGDETDRMALIGSANTDTGDHRLQHFNGWQVPSLSDRRLKYVGSENTAGLEKIKQLKVFNYTFKKDEKKTPRVGVIAQDLQKVFPDAVTEGKDGFLTIRMEDMFYAVVNAVKELDAKISAIFSRLDKHDSVLKQIQDELKKVQADNARLKKENAELKKILRSAQDDNKKLEARLDRLEAKMK